MLKLTLSTFASRLGVDYSAVGSWETGRRNPSPSSIKLISREFNVSENWLLHGTGPIFCAGNAPVPLADNPDIDFGEAVGRLLALPEDDLRRQVLRDIMELSPESWTKIADYARLLKVYEDAKSEDK